MNSVKLFKFIPFVFKKCSLKTTLLLIFHKFEKKNHIMSRTKHLISLLSSTEKHEFDSIVKIYLAKEFGYKKIVLTDGTNDTGIDIKVFDFQDMMIQYQLTIQKSSTTAEYNSFEKKLMADLVKAKENFLQHGYSNKLIFFYSQTMTNKRIRNFTKIAFKDYGLELEIIDANRIAEESESIIELQRALYNFSGLDKFTVENNVFANSDENLLYDLLSFGRPSEFKVQIIEVFILQTIYNNDSVSKEQIVEDCRDKFNIEENNVFYDKLLNNLLTQKKITKSFDKKNFVLTEFEKKRLASKIEQHDLDERVFLNEINNILKNYGQESHLQEYVINLKELYINNFDSDLKSISADADYNIGQHREFLTFISSKGNDGSVSKKIAKELLSFCFESKFIQKISAGIVYCKNINNDRLQNYLTTQKRVFIDTQIAIYALCYFYKQDSSYDNYFYRSVKSLIEFSQDENIKLYITERYIWEIQNHIKDAFKILPFTTLKNFSKLGNSNNVLYNFYLYLKRNGEIEDGTYFSTFLKEFGFEDKVSQNSYNSKVESYLSILGIAKHSYEKNYDITIANSIFNAELFRNGKYKSTWVRNNDSIMVEFLSDNDIDIHPLKPIFITWDKTFSDVQKVYFKDFPSAQKWLMMSPSKFIDVHAILKFSIDSETVSENLFALISDDLFSSTHNLLDTIKSILNPNNVVGLHYTNLLAEIREKEIHDISNNIIIPPENKEGEAVIDDVLYSLTNHYQDKEDSSYFEQFRLIFTKEELVDDVITILTESVNKYYTEMTIDKTMYEKFDKLINSL